MNVLGIDVGAGTVKSGVFSDHRHELHAAEEDTARSYAGLLDQLRSIAARAEREHGIGALGVGVPGFISRDDRVIERSPNMRFLDGCALEKDLAAAVGLPLCLENDANAAALGEFLALEPGGDGGHSTRPAHFVHLTLGSGIGSGIILRGRIYHGANGFAAELGHLLVNGQGRPCGCGNSGCAETESSGPGIVRSYQEYADSPAALSAQDVFVLLQQGNEAAQRAFLRAGVFLGILLAQIVYTLNPAQVSIGGGVAAAGEALLGPARAELSRRVIAKAVAGTAIAPARLGNQAGKTGAAALARELLPEPGGTERPARRKTATP